ncbi:MAG TPA: alpha/beta hydrolase [Puia sp.]|nr:alpha/beta hydrolase [Puia sp.]
MRVINNTLILGMLIMTLKIYGQNNGIDTILKLNLGNILQTVLVRGESIEKPLLLFVHGGPGYSEFRFFRSYNKELENNFITVNWDERGTGLSYCDSIPISSMTVDQFIEDAHQLIQQLKTLYHKKKVFLIGHSWGSVIGLNIAQKFPEDLYAYVGVGQVIDGSENEIISLQYTIDQAKKRADTIALKELNEVRKVYPSMGASQLQALYLQRHWLEKFGGVFHGHYTYDSLNNGVDKKENALTDTVKLEKGEIFSMNNLWPQFIRVNFFKTIKELKVPIYFFEGVDDYNTPTELVKRFVQIVKAPSKKIIWFYHSAHFPPFEEPQKFNTEILSIALLEKML